MADVDPKQNGEQQDLPTETIIALPVPQPIPMQIGFGLNPAFPGHLIMEIKNAIGTQVYFLPLQFARQTGANMISATEQAAAQTPGLVHPTVADVEKIKRERRN